MGKQPVHPITGHPTQREEMGDADRIPNFDNDGYLAADEFAERDAGIGRLMAHLARKPVDLVHGQLRGLTLAALNYPVMDCLRW